MMAEAMVRLSDLCNIVSEPVAPRERPEAVYVGLEHLATGRFTRIGAGKASDVRSSKSAFKSGDILYGKLRPYLDKAALVQDEGICSTDLLVLRPRKGVNPRFLVGVVHAPAFVEYAVSGTSGVQHPRTSWAHIQEFLLPEQVFEEQDKVADLLWLVHDVITACEITIATAYELKRVAMLQIFTRGLRGEAQKETEIGAMPGSWTVEPVGRHFSVVSGGTPSRKRSSFWSDGTIPWVKTTEVNYGVIRETEEQITQAGLEQSAAKLLSPGTLLLAMYGQGVTRGKVAILGIEAACNQACAAINPVDDRVDPKYLYHFLSFRYEEIRRLAHGGQQQNLNLEIVRALPVACTADRGEQSKIVAILDAIDRKIDLHRRKRAVLEELFKSLLHKLMTGEICVSDLDLPAHSRIDAETVFMKSNLNASQGEV